MTTAEILRLGARDIHELTDRQLKSYVSQAARTVNKRLSNIRFKSGIAKDAYRIAMESGGRFSVAGKDRRGLYNELRRIQTISSLRTATVKGAREVAVERISGLYNDDEYDNEDIDMSDTRLYDMFHKFEELYPELADVDSETATMRLREYFYSGLRDEEILERTADDMRNYYEKFSRRPGAIEFETVL